MCSRKEKAYDRDYPEYQYPHKQLCSSAVPQAKLAQCVTSWTSNYGSQWSQWIVPSAQTPNWSGMSAYDASKDGTTWPFEEKGPISRGGEVCQDVSKQEYWNQKIPCTAGLRKARPQTLDTGEYETRRSNEACEHQDKFKAPVGNTDAKLPWITLKIKAGVMRAGTISVCGIDGPDAKTLHATIKMMTADTKKIRVVTPVEVHGSTDDFGAKTCRTIVRGLDKETRAQDVLIGIKCTRHNTGKCRLDQVIVQ